MLHAFRIVRVGGVQILCCTAGDADGLWGADVLDLGLVIHVAVKNLDAIVAGVGHVNVPRVVDRNAANLVELSGPGSGLSPRFLEIGVLVEFRDAAVGAESVGDVHIARAIPGHIRRPVEAVARHADARHGIAAPAAAASTFRAGPAPGRRLCRRLSVGWHPWAGSHANILRLAAKHELQPPVGVELHHHVRSGIDDPDVVLRIHAHLLREIHCVGALADFLDEFARLVELEEPRSAVIERALVAEGRHGVAGARVHEQMAFRVGRHAGHFTQKRIGRQRQKIGVGVVADVGHGLRAQRGSASDGRRQEDQDVGRVLSDPASKAHHGAS